MSFSPPTIITRIVPDPSRYEHSLLVLCVYVPLAVVVLRLPKLMYASLLLYYINVIGGRRVSRVKDRFCPTSWDTVWFLAGEAHRTARLPHARRPCRSRNEAPCHSGAGLHTTRMPRVADRAP